MTSTPCFITDREVHNQTTIKNTNIELEIPESYCNIYIRTFTLADNRQITSLTVSPTAPGGPTGPGKPCCP